MRLRCPHPELCRAKWHFPGSRSAAACASHVAANPSAADAPDLPGPASVAGLRLAWEREAAVMERYGRRRAVDVALSGVRLRPSQDGPAVRLTLLTRQGDEEAGVLEAVDAQRRAVVLSDLNP